MMAVCEKLKTRKTTAADLPEEILCQEVFTRLPIKSAARFKCVSKSWLSLFSDPEFAKEHLTRNTTQNPNDYDCLIAKNLNQIVILSRYKETFALPSHGINLVGSIRGLVCLHHNEKLSLWNPTIHQSKEFTLPPSRRGDQRNTKGFGFDGVSDIYKVVVFSLNLRSASVYYSSSHSWIDVVVPDYVYHLESRGNILRNSITVVKDCPYWTFDRYYGERHPHKTNATVMTAVYLTVVKFDAQSNEFKLLPEFYFDINVSGESYGFSSETVDMNDRLTLIVHDINSSKFMPDIYSLDGEEGCCVWSKTYSIRSLDFNARYWYAAQGFYGGEIVFYDEGRFFCYDHKTHTIKRLSATPKTVPIVSFFRYTPSLVFLEGMKSVYLTTQTRRTTGLCSRVPRRLINSLSD